MANPGTAYDDPILGTDDQPRHMAGVREDKGDNGGVHRNSGIPNLAFVKTVQGLGDIDLAGRILYETLKSTTCPRTARSRRGPRRRSTSAGELGGPDAAKAVVKAWSRRRGAERPVTGPLLGE
jgi:Zn-dependent metalloprotease